MRNSSRNIFCFEKAEFKGMKNESGEINFGVGGKGWSGGVGMFSAQKELDVYRLGCDQNFPSCLEYLKCQSSHISLEGNLWLHNK